MNMHYDSCGEAHVEGHDTKKKLQTKQNLFEALVKLADMKKLKAGQEERATTTGPGVGIMSKLTTKVIDDKKSLF